MEEQKLIILSILKNFLGEPKNSINIESKVQWEFNCPSSYCKNDVNKFNLAYNSDKKVYKCWKCGERGYVSKLVEKYGKEEDRAKLKLILPYDDSNFINVFRKETINHDLITCPLPMGFIHLNSTAKSSLHKLALKYVMEERKISKELIEKFKIGYTEVGLYRNRIIIPSFNRRGNVNYFEARSFIKAVKPTYYKPDAKAFPNASVPDKYDIIFNEININWDLPVYLVEGPFDMIRIPNAILISGKTLSWLLIQKLIEHNCKIVICLDEDAFTDASKMFDLLTSLGLDAYVVDMHKKDDISKLFENVGQMAVTEVLMKRRKIDFAYKMEKSLNK